MKLHRCKHTCWHLVAKNNAGNVLFDLSEVTDMKVAWDFVREMKQNPLIEEIIWTRHEEGTGKILDETVHLKRQEGQWIKGDVASWSST